jgi:hypothetical protein
VLAVLTVFSYYFGFSTQLEYRLHKEILNNNNNDIRIAQYFAFINAFYYYPLGILTGFGTMASSHLNWFSQFYNGYDLKRYLFIEHNSILDFILSFGFLGCIFLLKVVISINWKIIIFLIITMSFNNVLNFLPFYVFLGILSCVLLFKRAHENIKVND